MRRFFRRGLTYANVTATLALVLALSGSAIAGTTYLLTSTSQIVDCAKLSVQVAGGPGFGAPVKKACKAAWKKVGITV